MVSNEPPRRGEYKTAAAYYASDEWLDIVRASLDEHRVCLASALRIGNAEQIEFFRRQVKACEQQLGIAPAPASSLSTAQQSLFNSLTQ